LLSVSGIASRDTAAQSDLERFVTHPRSGGAGLVVALVMLIVMSMSALALVRTVSTSVLVAGNFAFRQAAVMAAEAGSEAAIVWLTARATLPDLYADLPNQGYYASLPEGLDISGSTPVGAKVAIDWDKDECNSRTGVACVSASPATTKDDAGQIVQYVIHRLCRSAGSPEDSANSCLLYRESSQVSPKKGQFSYGASSRFKPNSAVYYRITTRVSGPRNTTVFVQTLMHF
jgi:Tfp pilus assembly protein PilX